MLSNSLKKYGFGLILSSMAPGLFLASACRNQKQGAFGGQVQSMASNHLENLLDDCEISLTVDDGPSVFASDMARELACRHDIRATFFVVGETILNSGSKHLNEMKKYGHLVANHTYFHSISNPTQLAATSAGDPKRRKYKSFAELTLAEKLAEVQSTHDLIKTYATGNVFLFRSPGNSWSESAASEMNSTTFFKYYVGPISWDVPVSPTSGRTATPHDFNCWTEGKSPEQCAEVFWQAIQQRNGRGTTLLVHDIVPSSGPFKGQHYTMKMLFGENGTGGLINKIKQGKCLIKNNFKFVRLDQSRKMADQFREVERQIRAAQSALGKPADWKVQEGQGLQRDPTLCQPAIQPTGRPINLPTGLPTSQPTGQPTK